MGVTHKVVKSQTVLAGMGGTQQGKFITIYPDDVAHARSIASALDGALNGTGLTGPAVSGEMSLGSSGLIFTRYGGFTKNTVTNPAGVEVSDDLFRGSVKPPWIEDPWTGGLEPGPAPAPASGGGSGGPNDE
jgi:hypothetical protein